MGELSLVSLAMITPETSCVFVFSLLLGRHFLHHLLIQSQSIILSELCFPQPEKNGNHLVIHWFDYSVTPYWGLDTVRGTGKGWIWSSPSNKEPAVWWGPRGTERPLQCVWSGNKTGVSAGPCGSTQEGVFQLAGGQGWERTSQKKGPLNQVPNAK